MRDHLPQSTPRTGPISTKLNFGSLVIRSRVTKSTAVPRAKAASLTIRTRRSAPRAADPSKSLPNGTNGTNTPQTLTPQNDTMAIDSSSNAAAQAQDTTTNAATTDVAMTDTAGDQSEQSSAKILLHKREDDGRNFDFYY
ncbi:hypothetical protein EYC80_009768 [Monilinia laxa]|uniref:Uncharacterized protein n=1 Tax=Monilinia laxa TaxID=61186 RepID=A0A5N6JSE6_MONLA|nr:hypothetical protein EYC80_009768 [Monilinia laxa]